MSYDEKFLALRDLPPQPAVPGEANFIQYRKTGKLLTLAGYGPLKGTTIPRQYKGKLGRDLTARQGYNAARLTGINLLLIARAALTSLDEIDYILNVEGFVNCMDFFTEQPTVMNGCSDLLVEIFGKQGKHTRSAIGVNSLAFDLSVEISMTLMIR